MTREHAAWPRAPAPDAGAGSSGAAGPSALRKNSASSALGVVAEQLRRAQLKNERQLRAVVNVRQLEHGAVAPREHVNGARPDGRCHHVCVRLTDSMSSSASSSTVRFLRCTTSRKFVKAYSVPIRQTTNPGMRATRTTTPVPTAVETSRQSSLTVSNLRQQQEV